MVSLTRRLAAVQAVVTAAYLLQSLPLVQADFAPDVEYTTMTVVAPIPAVAKPEYHWWDVVTERAHDIFAPKVERANKMFSQGRDIAADSGDYITSNVAEYGQQIKDNVNQAGQDAKNKAYKLGQHAMDSADSMSQKIKDNAEYLKDQAQDQADYWGRRAQHNAEHAKEKVQDDVHKAARHVKNTGEDFYDKLNYEGNRVAHEAEHGARRASHKCSGMFCCIRRYVSRKLKNFASYTRGSTSQLKSDLEAS
ncbi:hypothetical protein LPJ73_006930, partial [Coemansia sp. RSA 2703]